jgi:hypothetical protein
MSTRLFLVALALAAGMVACDISSECLPWYRSYRCIQNDLGQQCSQDKSLEKRVTIKEGSNDVVRDPAFENCTAFYCASSNGSRPYCTRRCENDADCNPSQLPCIPNQPCPADNWDCEVMIEFGELACMLPDENGECPVDDATGKVADPAKYCRAKDGTLPPGDLTSLAPDAGRP